MTADRRLSYALAGSTIRIPDRLNKNLPRAYF